MAGEAVGPEIPLLEKDTLAYLNTFRGHLITLVFGAPLYSTLGGIQIGHGLGGGPGILNGGSNKWTNIATC